MSPTFDLDLGFVGIPTFCKVPYVKDLEETEIEVAVVGAPLDQGAFNRPGARYGPRAIREASQLFGTVFLPDLGVYDIELGRYKLTDTQIVDVGDIPVAPTLCQENLDMITSTVQKLLQHEIFPIVLGGDHSITYPVIRAFQDVPCDIVHFDTHMDFFDDIMGIKISHANPIKRASELAHTGKITQIGIRGLLNPEPLVEEGKESRVRVITAKEAITSGTEWVLEQIPEAFHRY